MVCQKSMVVSIRFLLVVGCAFAVCTACQTVQPEPFSEEVISASVAPFESLRVGNESLSNHALKRTAFLFSGVDLPESSRADESTFNGTATSSDGVSYGVAAAVDARGYFVTAAHCVEGDPDRLRLVFHSAGVMEVKKARIVYMGKPFTEDSDFAVVHAPVPLSDVFVWADHYAKGDMLMCSGSRQNAEASNYSFKTVLSGGAIQEVGPLAVMGKPFQIIRHSAPIFHGNSGGPAVDKGGRLVAVNFAATFSSRSMRKPAMKYSSAIRPDLKWLQELIEKDARSQSW